MSAGRIVVGVDGSPEADGALAFALEEARLRNATLRIVCAWEPPSAAYAGEAFAATADIFVEAEQRAETVLRSALGQVEGSGVETEAIAQEGGAASVLAEQSAGALLLVVGSRRHGAAKRLLLGSVSTDLAHHVACPLAIVPH